MSFYVAEVGRVKGKQDLVDIYEVRYWKHDNDKEDFFSERFWVFSDIYT